MANQILQDDDYVVETGVWLTLNNISVRVYKTDEGVVCDMYPAGRELEDEIASTYALFSEAEPDEENT